MSDNDADKRPRMYGRIGTQDGVVELTVQGAEGETTDDIEDRFDEKLDKLVETGETLKDEGDNGKMCQ